jgi:hypothetical protein
MNVGLGMFATSACALFNRLLKKPFSCFDGLSTNGNLPMISIPVPFALSLSKGERGISPHPLKAQTRLPSVRCLS